jgi:thiamine-phosphate pyrophosphorylase
MLDDFTPGAERALAAASVWAQRLSSPAVLPLHLLLGLLDEPEGSAAMLLGRAGLDIERFRQPFVKSQPIDELASVPMSSAADMVIGAARSLAREHSAERSISTELLALAVIQSEEELVAELESFGLRRGDVLSRVSAESVTVAPDQPLDFADSTAQFDTARILDASANRAREALRVLDDYARFSRDDAGLTREIKNLRHELAEVLEELPVDSLLAARETQADVGTGIHTSGEMSRNSLIDVVQVNLKRLQEALRSLEEYGKLCGRNVGERLKRLRYRSYTLERMLLLGLDASDKLADARLYLLVGGASCKASLEWTIQEAAAGGVQIVQLREKNLDDRELIQRARNVRRWTRQAGVLFIVNDRPDIARLVGADGVHLGQDDLSVRDARRILGPKPLLGVSTHNLDQVRQAVQDGANYIGVGPTFPSTTKTFDELAGLAFVKAATSETSLPAFALGGITLENVADVVKAGAKRIAVSAAIAQVDVPRESAREFHLQLDAAQATTGRG